MSEVASFDEFRTAWLEDVRAGSPSNVELGHRFARKLVTQWLDVGDTSDDLVYCDGAGDGGIDVAYLDRGDSPDSDGSAQGDTWYLVQSKYGSAFQGTGTLLQEGQKVIDTLSGDRTNLSSLSKDLVERLTNFRRQASELDHLILVYATEEPLTQPENRAMADIQAMGRNRVRSSFGPLFEVQSVSLMTIYERFLENISTSVVVPMAGRMERSGGDLLVGSVSLLDLYDFLRAYRTQTSDLDQLYEKNVRRFLGTRGKVNRAIQQTLKENPERFGLFNNGITVVVTDFQSQGDGTFSLVDPYVVNGCQTTRTIWEVCQSHLDAGGTGTDPEITEWRERARQGVVVTKIVKVGSDGQELLRDITRFTNTQNAVREKDFLALALGFKEWASLMEDRYGIYLEIQRGGWDSRRALQRQRPDLRQFDRAANAFDLLKVYGSGWLGEAGTAFGRNAAFLPNGSVFHHIVNRDAGEDPFGVDDLYVAYSLQTAADSFGFGRGAGETSRRQTRFLYFMVVVELLKGVMQRARIEATPTALTHALLKLFQPSHELAVQSLLNEAIAAIDEYFTQGTDDCVFDEPAYTVKFNNNSNAYLKWDQLGKSDESSPRFRSLLAAYRKTMGRPTGGQLSPRDMITQAIAG